MRLHALPGNCPLCNELPGPDGLCACTRPRRPKTAIEQAEAEARLEASCRPGEVTYKTQGGAITKGKA